MASFYILLIWIITFIVLLVIWVLKLNNRMIEVLKTDITLLRDIQKLSENLDKAIKENEKEK
jgi:hypothetical protein